MRIVSIATHYTLIPLIKPFKTALRTVTEAASIVVEIETDEQIKGYGEAVPSYVITGDSIASIRYAIDNIIAPKIIGMSILHREEIFEVIARILVGNQSAKAAIDMAIYDCLAQHSQLSLGVFLGGYRESLATDYTVSVNEPAEMVEDAKRYVEKGFTTLKIKVGKDAIEKDLSRLAAIFEATGPEVTFRIDANQGWKPKEAVYALQQLEKLGASIDFLEQPVAADDLVGLQYVTNANTTAIPIMADESVFTAKDALRILEMKAADLINIKLMKSGGIYEALKIANIANIYGVDCMVGSMIETKLGITAAAHFAFSQPNVTFIDFDAPLMLAGDLISGGVSYEKDVVILAKTAGLGIADFNKAFFVEERTENE